MSYSEVREKMKTGDVIAFSGKGHFSEVIKWKTSSEISHVGIVAATNMFGNDRVLLCESTTLTNIKDVIHKTITKGVQMHFLSQRLDAYDGEVFWYPLRDKLEKRYEKLAQAWLSDKHASKTPYDMTQAMGAGLDFFDKMGLENEEDHSKLFCSELVTKVLQVVDEVGPHINSSEMTPADVISFSCLVEKPTKIS